MQPNVLKPKFTDEGDEDWMISFADMVTLLLCFFILFFSEKKEDSKEEAKEDIIREITTEFTPVPPPKDSKDRTLQGVSSLKLTEVDSEKMMSNINTNLKDRLNSLSGNNIDFNLETINSKELLLRVWNEGMFKSGSANLSMKGHTLVKEVAKTLSKYSGKIEIRIEGHTDSKAVKSGNKIRNNLVLSSLRAASAANVILEDTKYFNADDISVVGSGSKKLLVNDRSSGQKFITKNADKNRRIDFIIISKSVNVEGL